MPVIPQIGLGRSAAELKVNRANTDAFIKADLRLVTLIPQIRERSGTGTRLVAGAPRPTQMARLVDQTRTFNASPGKTTGADGTAREMDYQLILAWDAEIAKDDYWMDVDGYRWDVRDLLPDNGYERRAEVRRHGQS